MPGSAKDISIADLIPRIGISLRWPLLMIGGADQIFTFQQIQLLKSTYKLLHIDLLDLMRDMICDGNYISGRFNEEYIPGKAAFSKCYYYHDFLLIGFSDTKRIFHSVGYLKDKVFQRFEIPYDNMIKSLQTLESPKITLDFYRYIPDSKFELNIERIISGLDDYLHSKNSLKQYTGGYFYGLEAIQKLGEYYFDSPVDGKFDHRYTKVFLEHKFFTMERLKHLYMQGFLAGESYIDIAEQVYQMAWTVHMLGLKYSATKRKIYLEKIKEIMDSTVRTEMVYLKKANDELKKVCCQ